MSDETEKLKERIAALEAALQAIRDFPLHKHSYAGAAHKMRDLAADAIRKDNQCNS